MRLFRGGDGWRLIVLRLPVRYRRGENLLLRSGPRAARERNAEAACRRGPPRSQLAGSYLRLRRLCVCATRVAGRGKDVHRRANRSVSW